jgi:REP element-mobilizing transposase RayT
LPQTKLQQWIRERDQWLKAHPEPRSPEQDAEYQRVFPDRFNEWLDAGHGECWLRRPEIARIVAGALQHFNGQRYTLGKFVIMPNHVHALVTPLGEWTIEQILHSWKSYTATAINRQLRRTGTVWQSEYFDRLVRNAQALEGFVDYIRQNPVKAGLRPDEYILSP